MKSKAFSDLINQLASIARYGPHAFMNLGPDAFVEMYGAGSEMISFLAVGGVREWMDGVMKIYSSDPLFEDWFTKKVFAAKVADFIRFLRANDRACGQADLALFRQRIAGEPMIDVSVVAPIRGVTLQQPTVQLGNFTIYAPKIILDSVRLDATEMDDLKLKFLRDVPLIEIRVSAKDTDRCYEKANLAFSRFENVCNYITGRFYNETKVRVYNQNMPDEIECIMISDGQVTKAFRYSHPHFPVPLDAPVLQDFSHGYDKLWAWITDAKNDLQRKILISVEWCGRALAEPDPIKALLQFVIALESILQFDEGAFITPSIVSHLSDSVAFLVGTDRKSRMECAGYIKDLYSTRSGITHTGKAEVSSLSLHTAHVMCKKVIKKIMTEPPYTSFTSKKELGKYLANLKFG